MNTQELWGAFTRAGAMVHCIRYGGLHPDYDNGYREALEGEVIYCPENVAVVDIPNLFTVDSAPDGCDPVELAGENAEVADRVFREVVRRTGLRFHFSDDAVFHEFEFDTANGGPDPNVSVEPDSSVELDDMPVTVVLSAPYWLLSGA